MKILYSCLSQSWGGMEMFTVTAASKLKERGITVHLLCYPNSRIESSARKVGIETIPLKAGGYFHPLKTIKLALQIQKEKYDIIHTQASKDLWILAPALKLARSNAPLFFTKQLGSFIAKKDILHKVIYSRVTAAFAISSVIKRNLIETTPLPESKIFILHNGVDTKLFDPDKFSPSDFKEEIGIKPNELTIGMIARFTPGKGHEEFIKAAEIVSRKHENIKFIVVGEPSLGEDDYAEKIKALASELKLNDKIIFTGYRSDIPKVLAGMDIFVFPSHSEAFGIALVEAMAMKKAIVCSKADGTLDICIDNETGLFFEKGNHKDLANKLETLINDGTLRTLMASNARKRAVEKFDIERVTDKVTKFYSKYL